MRLPIDVSEVVIDQASDNAVSLRHLSLTCATFLPRSRYHLFRHIHIRTVEQMESSRDFLDGHPWMLPLVREVTLSFVAPKDESKRNARLLDVVPVHLLTRLPNLCEWNMGPVSPEPDANGAIPLLDLENRTVVSFHHFTLSVYLGNSSRIQMLKLHDIHFYRLSDFIGLVSVFTSIHSLTCSFIKFRREEELDQNSYIGGTRRLARPLQLSTLTVRV